MAVVSRTATMVVSAAAVTASCELEIDETVATETVYAAASVLNRPLLTGDVAKSVLAAFASKQGLTASQITPTTQDSEVQKSLIPILTAYQTLFAYVGFVDGTFAMIYNTTGVLQGAWREAGDDLQRVKYDINPSTGEQTGDTFGESAYDPRQRPWYIKAVEVCVWTH